MHFSIVASTFVIIFLAELPDKTMMSSIILGSRMAASRAFLGASVAFLIQVVIAVAVGRFISYIPRRPLDLVVGAGFLVGAILIIREMYSHRLEAEDAKARSTTKKGFIGQTFFAFAVTFIAEFGDLTQIATADLAAKTGDPVSVGVGSYLGLLLITALAVIFGSRLLTRIPIKPVQIASAAIMALLGVVSAFGAL